MSQNSLVKITLDGLLLISFRTSLPPTGTRCQAGVIVTKFAPGEEHELKIEVKGPGVSGCFTYSHENVLDKAPLWLYVGTEKGDVPTPYTAEPCPINSPGKYKPFSHVLDLEDFHNFSDFEIKPEKVPILNIPQGMFYSDKLNNVKYRELVNSDDFQDKSEVATETIAEIDLDKLHRAGIIKPHLILWSQNKSDSPFRISLEAGASYEVSVKNAPVKKGSAYHLSNHFRYYYHAFTKQPPKHYEIVIPYHHSLTLTEDAPPCINGLLKNNRLPG
ncbi:MAG TPA: hypothetical protein VJZ77_04105 [Blastocatellia bacterium]|nr:hypothetical protein [Blastocatellia bacterium]